MTPDKVEPLTTEEEAEYRSFGDNLNLGEVARIWATLDAARAGVRDRPAVPSPGESAGFDRLVDDLRTEFDQGHFIPWDEVISVVLGAGVRDPEEPRLASALRNEYANLSLPLGETYSAAKHERDTALQYMDWMLAAHPTPDLSAALDVERLARAMWRQGFGWTDINVNEAARDIAREYAALDPKAPREDEE